MPIFHLYLGEISSNEFFLGLTIRFFFFEYMHFSLKWSIWKSYSKRWWKFHVRQNPELELQRERYMPMLHGLTVVRALTEEIPIQMFIYSGQKFELQDVANLTSSCGNSI